MQKLLSLFVLISTMSATGCGEEKVAPVKHEPTVNNADRTTQNTKKGTILFFGNSLTAGYGIEPTDAFPALIQQKIDSMALPYTIINGGVSGETSAGGNQRIDFVLKQQPINVFVLELGANDGLRGMPLAETRKNLQAIIDKVKEKYPSAKLVLAGMQMPPNLGQAYTSEFRNLFPELAKANNMTLIPFLLEGVAGQTRLNLEDGIHPTAEGHRIVAETVWKAINSLL
ncbi:MAG: arylesterase [Bacteroidota bacterium]|nr:arylesterase [Bacteroidota bacterium]